MKLGYKIIIAFLVALFLGVSSALWSLKYVSGNMSIKNGVWTANLASGSSDAGMYTRATVAIAALFALNKTETIYYIASGDNSGKTFRSDCDYLIEGKDLDTRWWSITAYGPDFFLIPNEHERYSCNANNVVRDKDDSFKIHVSSGEKEGNWIHSGDRDGFYLTLRLYNPSESIYGNPGRVELPSITMRECR